MTWIKTVPPTPDNPELMEALESQRSLYPSEYGPDRRGERRLHPLVANDSIVLSHSLLPQALKHAFSTFGALMNPDLPLARRDHEMIAATVSALNRCFY
jgi:alkylhydroperoxidase family enzyme